MKKLLGVVGVCAFVAPICYGQGCNELISVTIPPSPARVRREVYFFPPAPPLEVPTVEESRAFAYVALIGVMDCDVLIVADCAPAAYRFDIWEVNIVVSGGGGEFDTEPNGVGAYASATGPAGVQYFNGDYWSPEFKGMVATAEAWVGTDPNSNAIAVAVMDATAGPQVILSPNQCGSSDDTASWGWGAAAAIASAGLDLESTTATSVDVEDNLEIDLPIASDQGRRFVVPILGNGAGAAPVIVAPGGFVHPGWTGSVIDGRLVLTGQTNVSVPSTGVTILPRTVSANDKYFDADCDGRFTQDDVDIVNGWLNTDVTLLSPPAATEPCPRNANGTPNSRAVVFDIDSDDIIDADDVQTLQDVLDALESIGQEAGIFGDVDRDGDLDCADLSASTTAWNTVLGDADYTPALDVDLDGDIDAADEDAFYSMSPFNIDFNRSGVVNSQDNFDFLTAFFASSPSADFNGDGFVNSQDYFDFTAAWSAGC